MFSLRFQVAPRKPLSLSLSLCVYIYIYACYPPPLRTYVLRFPIVHCENLSPETLNSRTPDFLRFQNSRIPEAPSSRIPEPGILELGAPEKSGVLEFWNSGILNSESREKGDMLKLETENKSLINLNRIPIKFYSIPYYFLGFR